MAKKPELKYEERLALENAIRFAVRQYLRQTATCSALLILDEGEKVPTFIVIGEVNEVKQHAARSIK